MSSSLQQHNLYDTKKPMFDTIARAIPFAIRMGAATRAAFAFGLMALALTGCFRPVYGDLGTGNASIVQEEMKKITIAPIPERNGHYVYNALVERINGSGETVSPKYMLKVSLTQGINTPTVDYFSGAATSSSIVITANYALTDIKTGKSIASDTVSQSHAYDRGAQRYANISAARSAEIFSAKDIAEQIADRIAVALSTLQNNGTVAAPITTQTITPSSTTLPGQNADQDEDKAKPNPVSPPWQ